MTMCKKKAATYVLSFVSCSLFSLNRLFVWLFRWYPYGKLTNSAFAGFFYAKTPDLTRSIDTGFPWRNPTNAPIFVNSGAAAVWYIIKKASANFRKRTVLYRVPRMGDWHGVAVQFLSKCIINCRICISNCRLRREGLHLCIILLYLIHNR